MRYLCILGGVFLTWITQGQVNEGLISYISFDDCNIEANTGSIIPSIGGAPECICGAEGDAIQVDGNDDFLVLENVPSGVFLGDYSISFYFRPESSAPGQDLFSFRNDCSIDSILAMNYNGVTREIIVDIYQNVNRNEIITAPIKDPFCWHHVVFTKNNTILTIYINGKRVIEEENSQPILITNDGMVSLFNSPCIGSTDVRFQGSIDEFRLYNRGLTLRDVLSLYKKPDDIINSDTTIIQGNSVPISLSQTCATSLQWFPNTGIDDPTISNPVLSPQITTEYVLQMQNPICSVNDTILVNVIEPDAINCDEIFLPKAFTPNGDGLNDIYVIDNPYVFDRLITFEIFSPWGEMVFATTNAFSGWDGSYRGEDVNPGVFTYKIEFVCQGQENSLTGSFAVLR